MEKEDVLKTVLISLMLLFIAFLIYSPHFSYKLPIHVDEWKLISWAGYFKENGLSYIISNPIEVGFVFVLVVLSLFFDLIQIYHILPALNIILVGLVLFLLMKKKYDYFTAFLALIFLASLKSNINILGLWFFIPVVFGISFIYLTLFNFEEAVATNNNKKFYIAIAALFLLAFIHQSSFLAISFTLLIFFSIKRKFVIKNKKLFYPFLALLIPAFLTAYYFSQGFADIMLFLNKFSWGPLSPQINFNPFLFYGIVGSLFAALGYYFTFKKKEMLVFRIYILVPLINMLIFLFIDKTFFSSYQRYLYHFMIAAIPFSAIGAKYFFGKVVLFFKSKKVYVYFIGILLIASIFILGLFYSYYKIHPQTSIVHLISESELKELRELEKFPYGVVLAPLTIANTLEAAAHKKPMFYLKDFDEWDNQISRFYSSDCEDMEEFIYSGHLFDKTSEITSNYDVRPWPDYILSSNDINCGFFEELYSGESFSFYKVNLEKGFKLKREVIFDSDKPLIADMAGLDMTDLSLKINVKPDKNSYNISEIMSSPYRRSPDSGWVLFIKKGRIQIDWGDGNNINSNTGRIQLKEGEWNEIKVIIDDKFYIYVNGEIDLSLDIEPVYDYSAYPVAMIGKFWKYPFSGSMKDIEIS